MPAAVPPFVVTVAVSVSGLPAIEGFALAASAAVEVAIFTVSLSAADVLVKSFASPPYDAVMECVPAASDEVWKVVTALVVPEAVRVPVPICVVPS